MWEDAKNHPIYMHSDPAPETRQSARPRARSRHDRWIIAIGVFKQVQGVLFLLLGIGALRLIHADLLDMAERLIVSLRFDPESHFVSLVLGKIALLDPHRMKQISAAIFTISALDFLEGTGLVLEKAWAEYVTLVLTASFLPWEAFEVIRHVSWPRAGLFAINLAVVVYLGFYVRMRVWERRQRHRERHEREVGRGAVSAENSVE
jgi:uncharacterized membrane protein (DUF2068 family)